MTVSIGERIRKVRKNEDLSQEAFANKMAVTRNMIATYELNRVEPTDLFIDSLCTKFNIDEKWLRSGEGEMYIVLDENDKFAALLGDVLLTENEQIKDIITKTLELDEGDLIIINQLIDGLIKKNEKK